MLSPHELLKEAHDPQVAVSILLRKALVFATTAGQHGLTEWINWELNGYGPAKDIPEYRRPKGMLITHDPFGRATPILFRPVEAGLEEQMCSPPIGLPITKLEAELKVHRGERTIETNVDPVVLEILREHWGVLDARMSYSIADFHAIVEGVRTKLVAELARMKRADGSAMVKTHDAESRRSPMAWFRALGLVERAVLLACAIISAVVAVLTVGPCKPAQLVNRPAQLLTTMTGPEGDSVGAGVPESPGASSGTRHPVAGERRSGHSANRARTSRLQPWRPAPYAGLRIKGFRTHPVEFKLWGDSVIVDVLMEPGTTVSERWSSHTATRPLLKLEIYSGRLLPHADQTDGFIQEGQWVVAEKDRAVFVVPKDRILFKNLRISPCVGEGDSLRYPTVTGKWMRKGDTRSWYFWLKIDNSGAITKTGWKYAGGADARIG